MICSTMLHLTEDELRNRSETGDSPTTRDMLGEYKKQKELIVEAAQYAEDFILQVVRNNLQPINCAELIALLTDRFDYSIRLHLWDIVENLKSETSKVSDYARWHFQDDELENELRGENEKQKKTDESTLDELFARTLQLRSTDKFKEVIEFVAKLREYSPFNNMLVKLQRPDARYYATATHWKKKFKREVKLDAIPIVILRPMGPVMLVYDVDDTEGNRPLPAQIENPFSVGGEFDSDFYYQTLLNCKKIGISIDEKSLAKSHAGSAIRRATAEDVKLIIQINQNHDVKIRYATICHELAHLFLGHLGGDPYGKEWTSRIGLTLTQRELEAEAVSYILCVRAGLASNSAEYLSAYLEDSEDIKKISVEAIMKTVAYVEQMSSKSFRPRRPKDPKSKESK